MFHQITQTFKKYQNEYQMIPKSKIKIINGLLACGDSIILMATLRDAGDAGDAH